MGGGYGQAMACRRLGARVAAVGSMPSGPVGPSNLLNVLLLCGVCMTNLIEIDIVP
jgi:hypothetical protein